MSLDDAAAAVPCYRVRLVGLDVGTTPGLAEPLLIVQLATQPGGQVLNLAFPRNEAFQLVVLLKEKLPDLTGERAAGVGPPIYPN